MNDERALIILVASMSGTADMVADKLAAALKERGENVRIVPMDKAAIHMFDQRKHFIICSSTYGKGDVPDNGQAFYKSLRTDRPDLSGVIYGVVALGDMTYSMTFCGGGRRLDIIFSQLGARRIGERIQHDRQSGQRPEVLALEWLDSWLPQFTAARAAAEG